MVVRAPPQGAIDQDALPVVSVEAAALFQFVSSTVGAAAAVPPSLTHLASTWASGQCLFVFDAANGWRGAFSEHRMWSSVLLRKERSIKTPYPAPTVRGWFPAAILDDLVHCVGAAAVERVAATVAACGFDGAPDLVLWNANGALTLVEVKTGSDRLHDAQARMLAQLSRLEGVSCHVCCPAAARKRMAAAMTAHDETSDEDA